MLPRLMGQAQVFARDFEFAFQFRGGLVQFVSFLNRPFFEMVER